MNLAFTKIIKAGERQREFNFRQLPGDGSLFHVDVSDDRGNRIMFRMERKDNGELTILPPDNEMPKWIWDASPQLAEAINEMLQSV